MAILGIETGAFGEGGDSGDGRPVEPRVLLESPAHERDVNRVGLGSLIDIPITNFGPICETSNGGAGSPQGLGTDAFLGYATNYIYFLGASWQPLTQAQYFNNPSADNSVVYIYKAPWGSDISLRAWMPGLLVAGKYSGSCGFQINRSVPGKPNLQMSGSVSFQIISADLTQTIDITPANCGKTAQGIVPLVFDSRTVFGRTTAFFAQASMTNQDDPGISHSPSASDFLFFGPQFQVGLVN